MKHQNRLAQARADAGMTQQEAAVKAGLTIRYYQAVEAGKSMPTLKRAHDIARALGSTVDDLWMLGRR